MDSDVFKASNISNTLRTLASLNADAINLVDMFVCDLNWFDFFEVQLRVSLQSLGRHTLSTTRVTG